MDNFYQNCPAKMNDGRFLTDYRTANTREQYIKSINGIINTNQYRTFLMTNSENIMDNEWTQITAQNSCPIDSCIHMTHSRAQPGSTNAELNLYNSVKTGKIKSTDKNFPVCPKYKDYRMTQTKLSE